MDHTPAVAMPVPTAVGPSYRVTVLPASAVPVKVGLVTLVMLSVSDTPVSDAASRSGADGAAGAMVSMVTARAADASADVAGHIRRLGGDAVGAVRQGRGGDGPIPVRRGDAGADRLSCRRTG